MRCPVFYFLLKGSVLLVDIEIITFVKVIGNIDVRIEVLVDIRYHYPQAKPNKAAKYAGFFTYIHKFTVVIP